MTGYVRELRSLVGSRPLILAGDCVLLADREGRLLLQHRTDNDTWGLPGGSMEPGEALEETARREVLEEVGITCGALHLLNVFSGPALYYRYPHGDEVHNVVAAYVCRDFAGRPAGDGHEVKDVRWFPLDALPEALCPPDRPVVEAFVRSCAGSGVGCPSEE